MLVESSNQISSMQPSIAVLIGAGCATLGWLYSARRARTLSKKQHTINVMLQAAFSEKFREALEEISPILRGGDCPDLLNDSDPNSQKLYKTFRFVLNHYEFVAAGLRNGDFDEGLVRDSERATIMRSFEACQETIFALRNTRKRQTIYEHLDWLHSRWERRPPGFLQRMIEWVIGRPLPGRRVDSH